MKTQFRFIGVLFGLVILVGCTQSTPSMMNSSKPIVQIEKHIEQVPMTQFDDVAIALLAEDFRRFGASSLELTMNYDSKSKSFTAMRAVNELKIIKEKLNKKGIRNVKTQTHAVSGQDPAVLISYDTASALPPSDCGAMPGLEDFQTTRELGNYRFGCAIETMLTKQIYSPSDLQGTGGTNGSDGRRSSNVVETYANGQPRESLEGIEREDLTSE